MAATVYKPAHDAAITFNSVTFKCVTASIGVEIEEFDCTNTESNGAYEFGMGVKKHTLNWEIPVTSTASQIPTEGSFASASWSDGVHTYSGDGAVTNIQRRGGGRGGFTVSGNLVFTGTVTRA